MIVLYHMMQYYRKTSHTTFDCTYHIVWITKYRYPVMVGDIATRARDLVREICKENQVEIVRGTVARDHIHIYISIPPYLSVSKLVQYLKGKTSRKIQQEFPELSSRELTFHVFSNLRGFSPEWFNCTIVIECVIEDEAVSSFLCFDHSRRVRFTSCRSKRREGKWSNLPC